MRWFFFGSLLDSDVRRVVLGREVAAVDVEAATLHGFVRLRAANDTYPSLRAQTGAVVEGIVVNDLNDEDVRRVLFFEGDEFSVEHHPVRLAAGATVTAAVLTATERLTFEQSKYRHVSTHVRGPLKPISKVDL